MHAVVMEITSCSKKACYDRHALTGEGAFFYARFSVLLIAQSNIEYILNPGTNVHSNTTSSSVGSASLHHRLTVPRHLNTYPPL